MDTKTLKNLHLINETFAAAGQAELSRLTVARLNELEHDLAIYREATIRLARENFQLEDELGEFLLEAAFG